MSAGIPVRTHSRNCLTPALAAIFLVPTVVLFCAMHPPQGEFGATKTESVYTARLLKIVSYNGCSREFYTNLVQQQAEQNAPSVAQNVHEILRPDFATSSDTYDGFAGYWAADPLDNLYSNVQQLLFKFVMEMPLQFAFVASGFLCLWMAGPVVLSKL